MEFTRSAWHVKLLNWAYGDTPKRIGLCEYFWVVVGTIGLIPLLVYWKIGYTLVGPVSQLMANGMNWNSKTGEFTTILDQDFERRSIKSMGGIIFVVISILTLLFSLFFLVVRTEEGTLAWGLFVSPIIVMAILIPAMLWPIIRGIRQKAYGIPEPSETKNPNLVWAFVKARKQAVCPIVTISKDD